MDLASLQIEIDSRKAAQAKKDLEDLAGAAEKTESATESLSKATAEGEDRYKAIARAAVERQAALTEEVRSQISAGRETRKYTEEMKEAVRRYTEISSAENRARLANERQAKAMADAAVEAERNQSSLQRLMAQIDPLEGKLSRLDDMEQQLTKTFRQGAMDAETYSVALAKITGQRKAIGDQQLKQIGDGAEQAAESMGRLGMNTSLAQRDLITLGRAAASGQWTQASSSMVSLGRSSGAMSAAFSVAGVSILGLVGSVGVLAAAYYQGRKEADEYNRAIILSGNYAGTTSAQLAGMAARIDQGEGKTRKAAQALALMVGSGKLAGENMEQIGRAAVAMSDIASRSIKEIVSEFESLGRDPVRAITDLNNQYHFLTASVYEQITALAEQGREQEATSLAERAYASEMESRASQIKANLGAIERGWNAVARAARGAWDEMLDVGRGGLGAELAQAQAKLVQLQDAAYDRGSARRIAQVEEQRQIVADLQERVRLEGMLAADRARQQRTQDAGIDSIRWRNDHLKQFASNADRLSDALKNLDKQIAAAKAAGTPFSDADIATIRAGIEKQFAEKPERTAATRIASAKNEDPLGVFIKDVHIDHAMSEYQRYLDFIDTATGRAKERQFAQQQEWLDNALDLGQITYEEYAKAMDAISDKGKKTMSQMDQFTIQAARNIESALGDGLYNILKGSFDDIGQAFGDMVMRMAAEAAAANLAGALFGDYGKSGQLGGIIGNIASSFLPGGAPDTSYAPAHEFSDGGYTGPGGKYDFAGTVHKGEGVLNQEEIRAIGGESGFNALRRAIGARHSMGGMGGRPALPPAASPNAAGGVVVNITNNAGQPVGASQPKISTDAMGRMVIDLMLNDLRTNGPYTRQLKGVMA